MFAAEEASVVFREVLSAAAEGRDVCASGVWGCSAEMLAAALVHTGAAKRVLVLAHSPDQADRTAEDLPFFTGSDPLLYPPFDSPPGEGPPAVEVLGERIGAAAAFESGENRILVAPVQAVLQPTPDRETLRSSFLEVREGDILPPERLVRWLVDAGFRRERMAERPGEFAVRGGIIDVFPLLSDFPFRLEFFGDDVESVRTYDPVTQRTVRPARECLLRGIGTGRLVRDWEDPRAAHLFDFLPADTLVFLLEPGKVRRAAAAYHGHHGKHAGVLSPDALAAAAGRFPRLEVERVLPDDTDLEVVDCGIRSLKRFEVGVEEALGELGRLARSRRRVVVCCNNEGERERLLQLMAENGVEGAEVVRGRLSAGFDAPGAGFALVPESELFNRYRVRRRHRKFAGAPLTDLVELKPGDLVVHVVHGIARYEGMETLKHEGGIGEYVRLRFANDVRVYVPLHNIELVQKYIGAKGEAPPLSVVGGSAWKKRKEAARKAVEDLAQELLRTQALRMTKSGTAHPLDTDWQRRFEASFIYEETDDQLRVAEEIKKDMESPRPMDRLLCGDVGFGKTEVVIRAAFKAVMGGRQVAVLVPTTLLAEQHYRTFRERMADYPVRIEALSRFKTRGEQADITRALAEGSVDIVIGTHRLLSADVKFKDLGLVVIDEEHKFGVEHKEALRKLRANVDVLALSATPIPRTLHMSLVGIRDVSNLYTAPAERLPIITKAARFDRKLIRQAITRELDRGGQTYFLHNRVDSIYRVADLVSRTVPEARVAVGHGQMPEHELEEVMLRFLRGEVDVLVCTTIIESGIDIPNANTMIINDADRFGLATLHQLRGRIGRYKHQGYCYLLVPAGRTVTAVGKERLKAIEEFSDLGAGFQLAMRDLEIRGAGNILGREQHGHINAVGYELYCSLLEKTVRRLKGEKVEEDDYEVVLDIDLDAYFPPEFPEDDAGRIALYRKLVRIRSEEEADELRRELEDIYGPLPRSVLNLFDLQKLKMKAKRAGIYRISVEEDGLAVRFRKFTMKRAEEFVGPLGHMVGGTLEDGVIIRGPGLTESASRRVELLKKLLNGAAAGVR